MPTILGSGEHRYRVVELGETAGGMESHRRCVGRGRQQGPPLRQGIRI
jgi:hypothetical protein